MPKESLYEESAQSQKGAKEAKWYTAFHVSGWIALFLTALQTAIFLMVILPEIVSKAQEGVLTGGALAFNILLWVGMSALLGLFSFLLFRARRRFNVSYDYLFVEDELRLTRVFNGRKRKFIATVKADEIMQLGKCDGEAFDRVLSSMQGAKPHFLTPNSEPSEDKMFIYLLVSDKLGKILYVLECRQKLLECLVMAAGRSKYVS